VEEVNYDEIDGKVSSSILPCDFEELFLGLVTEFALPEAETVLWHYRHLNEHKINF
jgi:hypothetical protein